MSDPTDLVTTAGTAVGSSGLVAAFMRWLAGREAQQVATEIALLRNDVNSLKEALEKNDGIREDVALLKRDVAALHERLDGKRGRR